jgi:hypothetical protein
MSDDEEYEYDYGSDAEYDYGSDGGNENEENDGANDTAIEVENSFYGMGSVISNSLRGTRSLS